MIVSCDRVFLVIVIPEGISKKKLVIVINY